MKTVRKTVSLSLVLAFACALVWAQATSQIQGIVLDTSGAVIPGIEVKATQTETGITRASISSEDGRYVLPNLAIGPYKLEVSAPGFSPYVQTGIVLQVASTPTVNITLRPGAISETVQVEANAGLVETQSTSLGNVIENQRIAGVAAKRPQSSRTDFSCRRGDSCRKAGRRVFRAA